MQIDTPLIKLILLAIPGIVSCLLYGKLTGKKRQRAWHELFEIVLFSLVSYGILGGIYYLVSWFSAKDYEVTFFKVLFSKGSNFSSWYEIIFASIIGVVISFVSSLSYTRNWFNRLGYAIRVTKRNFDGELWESFHANPSVRWVFVRDHKLDLIYYGWIQGYSESGMERELILREVDVYMNKMSKGKLYSVDVLYISRERHDLSIEVPVVTKNP